MKPKWGQGGNQNKNKNRGQGRGDELENLEVLRLVNELDIQRSVKKGKPRYGMIEEKGCHEPFIIGFNLGVGNIPEGLGRGQVRTLTQRLGNFATFV